MKPFFLVWREGNRNPMKRHDTPDEAEKEAARLAIKEGCPIHVLELRATCYPDIRVRWEYPEKPKDNVKCSVCGYLDCICYEAKLRGRPENEAAE